MGRAAGASCRAGSPAVFSGINLPHTNLEASRGSAAIRGSRRRPAAALPFVGIAMLGSLFTMINQIRARVFRAKRRGRVSVAARPSGAQWRYVPRSSLAVAVPVAIPSSSTPCRRSSFPFTSHYVRETPCASRLCARRSVRAHHRALISNRLMLVPRLAISPRLCSRITLRWKMAAPLLVQVPSATARAAVPLLASAMSLDLPTPSLYQGLGRTPWATHSTTARWVR